MTWSDAQDRRDLLAGVTYRRAWDLHLVGGELGDRLIVGAVVEDSYSGEIVRVTHQLPVPPGIIEPALDTGDRRHLFGWLRRGLHQVEAHESAEWLKLNGKILFDPHAHRLAARP